MKVEDIESIGFVHKHTTRDGVLKFTRKENEITSLELQWSKKASNSVDYVKVIHNLNGQMLQTELNWIKVKNITDLQTLLGKLGYNAETGQKEHPND